MKTCIIFVYKKRSDSIILDLLTAECSVNTVLEKT